MQARAREKASQVKKSIFEEIKLGYGGIALISLLRFQFKNLSVASSGTCPAPYQLIKRCRPVQLAFPHLMIHRATCFKDEDG
jgi:hypothetical protein